MMMEIPWRKLGHYNYGCLVNEGVAKVKEKIRKEKLRVAGKVP